MKREDKRIPSIDNQFYEEFIPKLNELIEDIKREFVFCWSINGEPCYIRTEIDREHRTVTRINELIEKFNSEPIKRVPIKEYKVKYPSKQNKTVTKYFHPFYYETLMKNVKSMYETMRSFFDSIYQFYSSIITFDDEIQYRIAYEDLTPDHAIFERKYLPNICSISADINRLVFHNVEQFQKDILEYQLFWGDPYAGSKDVFNFAENIDKDLLYTAELIVDIDYHRMKDIVKYETDILEVQGKIQTELAYLYCHKTMDPFPTEKKKKVIKSEKIKFEDLLTTNIVTGDNDGI